MTPKFITRFSSESADAKYLHVRVHRKPGAQPVVTFFYSTDPEAPDPSYQRSAGPSTLPALQGLQREIMGGIRG